MALWPPPTMSPPLSTTPIPTLKACITITFINSGKKIHKSISDSCMPIDPLKSTDLPPTQKSDTIMPHLSMNLILQNWNISSMINQLSLTVLPNQYYSQSFILTKSR